MRLDDSLTDSGIKEKTIIHLNQYLDDVKLVNKKLELRVSELIGKEEENIIEYDEILEDEEEITEENDEDGYDKEAQRKRNHNNAMKQNIHDKGHEEEKKEPGSKSKDNSTDKSTLKRKILCRFREKCHRVGCTFEHPKEEETGIGAHNNITLSKRKESGGLTYKADELLLREDKDTEIDRKRK